MGEEAFPSLAFFHGA
jgi:hypothetical protein